MIKTRTLNVSVDGLEVAFQGSLPSSALEYLEAEKARAEDEGEELYTSFAGLEGFLLPNGAKGGYRYIFNQGLMAAKWQIKHSSDPMQWNFYAKVPSGALLEYGLKGCIERLHDDLRCMRAIVQKDSVSRFDVCADIEADEFEINPSMITAHSSTTARQHRGFDPELARKQYDDNHVEIVGLSRIETLTIGKMPNRQIQIYDKRKQAIKKRLKHWFDVWRRDPKDKNPVWRVEFRAGKNHLKDWNIRTLDDLVKKSGDMVLQGFKDIRYLSERKSNITRSRVHPIWETARNEIVRFLQFARQGAKRGIVKECFKRQKIEEFEKMFVSLVAGYCELQTPKKLREKILWQNGGSAALMERLFSLGSGAIARAIDRDPKDLRKKMSRTRKKYFFLDDTIMEPA